MAKPLNTASIAAPGFYGLNTQESSVTLAAGFALQTDNCIIDKFGRLGSRKGWAYQSTTVVATVTITSASTTATVTDADHNLTTGDSVTIAGAVQTEYNGAYTITVVDPDTYTYTFAGSGTSPATGTITSTYASDNVDIKGGHEFIDINGEKYFGVWNDTSFFIIGDGTADNTASAFLTKVTYIGSNVVTTDGWDVATLNDAAYLFHRDYLPIYFNVGTGQLDDVVNVGHGAPPQANTVLSAYGRLWVADTLTNKTTVYWSDLLNGADFNGAGAGQLDISSVLVNGNDEIVALGAQNGRLIIFCKDTIVIYANGASSISGSAGDSLDPKAMELVEVITGVGCIVRDSVQNTGTDILFMSASGLRSLGRVIQEKSQPMRDLSKNVRDQLIRDVLNADVETIRSVYSADNAFYLLLIPEYSRVYCFDMRTMLQDGSSRVTLWDNQTHNNMILVSDTLYFAQTNGVARYTGYTDNGEKYVMKYYTNYFDFENATALKMLKRLLITLIGASGQDFILKAGFDYSDSYLSFASFIESRANAEYGEAEYNTTHEFTLGTLVDTVRAPLGGTGNVLQVGFEATINGAELSIQKLDIYIKEGRIY